MSVSPRYAHAFPRLRLPLHQKLKLKVPNTGRADSTEVCLQVQFTNSSLTILSTIACSKFMYPSLPLPRHVPDYFLHNFSSVLSVPISKTHDEIALYALRIYTVATTTAVVSSAS